jgi:hypothetical protein
MIMAQTRPTLKFLFFIVPCICITNSTFAQTDTSSTWPGTDQKNIVKLNVAALFVKNFSFQYERALTERTSFALGLRVMPKSGLPLKSQIEDLIDDPGTWRNAKNLRTGNFSITPEYRYYFGKGVFNGFYLAPFVKYTNYTAELPFEFDVTNPVTNVTTTEMIPLEGSVNTYTGGVLVGAQWRLSKVLSLDWWILGPNYGASNGHITGERALNVYEQQYLRNELEDLDPPLTKTSYTVDENGTEVDFKGGWAGVRAGLSLGIRF